MGSRAKTPDMSAQNRAAQEQSDELKRQQEEARVAKEALAAKNTDELRVLRRRGRGRASLITTSEKGTENNTLDKEGSVTKREDEIGRINQEGRTAIEDRARKKLEQERIDALARRKGSKRPEPLLQG